MAQALSWLVLFCSLRTFLRGERVTFVQANFILEFFSFFFPFRLFFHIFFHFLFHFFGVVCLVFFVCVSGVFLFVSFGIFGFLLSLFSIAGNAVSFSKLDSIKDGRFQLILLIKCGCTIS